MLDTDALTSASLEPNMRNFLRLSTLLTLRRTFTLASTVQYSTVQYSTAQYSTVQYSTLHYSTVCFYLGGVVAVEAVVEPRHEGAHR